MNLTAILNIFGMCLALSRNKKYGSAEEGEYNLAWHLWVSFTTYF